MCSCNLIIVAIKSTIGKSKEKLIRNTIISFNFFWLLEFFLWPYIHLICCNFLQSCFYHIHFLMPFILFSFLYLLSIYNLLSSESILYFFLYYFLFYCCTFFSFVRCSRIIERFLSWTFTLLLQLLSQKISAIPFLETCLVFFSFFSFHCNFLFQKFQCCFSYCSNF